MNATTIIHILTGYENQLNNTPESETEKAKWLKEQINEGYKMIAQFGTYTN